jgi:hypothetical protein
MCWDVAFIHVEGGKWLMLEEIGLMRSNPGVFLGSPTPALESAFRSDNPSRWPCREGIRNR